MKVFDWHDNFDYGRFYGCTIRAVWNVKPSYLVWTLLYTNNTFTEDVMAEIRKFMANAVDCERGVTITMIRRWNERFNGGPW